MLDVSGKLKDCINELTKAKGKRIKKKVINFSLKVSLVYLKASLNIWSP